MTKFVKIDNVAYTAKAWIGMNMLIKLAISATNMIIVEANAAFIDFL